MVRLGRITPQAVDEARKALQERIGDAGFASEDALFDWKAHAEARKAARTLREKSALLEALHWLWERAKSLDYSLSGRPLLPLSTSAVLLLVLHSRLSTTWFVIVAALLLSLNPLYVVAALVVMRLRYRHMPVRRASKRKKAPADAHSQQTQRAMIGDVPLGLDFYVVGNDLSAYYCAALLGCMGYSCCVLEPTDAPPVRVALPGVDGEITCCDLSGGRMDRLKVLLDAVRMPGQQPLEYVSVGASDCDEAHTIVRLCGGLKGDGDEDVVVAIRPNLKALLENIRLHDSTMSDQMAEHIQATLEQLVSSQQSLTGYLLSRIVRKSDVDDVRRQIGSAWNSLHAVSCEQLFQGMPQAARSLATAYFQEDPALPPTQLSAVALATALAQGISPHFAIKGGYNAIIDYLVPAIQQSGGVVVRDAPIAYFRTEEEEPTSGRRRIAAIGLGHDLELPLAEPSQLVSCVGFEYTRSKLGSAAAALTQVPGAVSAGFDGLPVQQWSTVKLVLAVRCDDPAAFGIGPQTFVEVPRADDFVRHLRIFFPSLREQPTNSGSHTCVLEAGVDHDVAAGDAAEQRLVQMLLGRLERLFPAITQEALVSYRLIVHAPETKPLAQSVDRYQSKLSAQTDIAGLVLGGCDVSTFGVGGCLQAGWVAANAALGYGPATLLAGTNVLNDILHE